MKFKIANLGPIKNAEIQLKPLTVFVGENNTGKTYAAYLIYQFFAEQVLSIFPFKKKCKQIVGMEQLIGQVDISSVLKRKQLSFDIPKQLSFDIPIIDLIKNNKSYFEEMFRSESFKNLLDTKIKNIVEEFPNFIGGEKKNFEGLNLSITFEDNKEKITNSMLKNIKMADWQPNPFVFPIKEGNNVWVFVQKEKNSESMQVTLLFTGEIDTENIAENKISEITNGVVVNIIFSCLLNYNLPQMMPYIFPAQRNTLSIDIVQKAINSFFRDIGLLKQQEGQIRSSRLLEIPSFSRPMNNFLRFLDLYNLLPPIDTMMAEEEFLEEADRFEKEVLEGKLKFEESKDKETKTLKFLVENDQKTLDLITTSSMVQQLSSLILYLKSMAKPNQLIIIDEPETNLHPKAQIKFVELISFFVNHGVWVIITTHTPYVVDYLNNLTTGFKVYKKMKGRKMKTEKFPLDPKRLIDPQLVSAYEFKKDGTAKSIMKKGVVEWDTFGIVTEQIERIYYDLQAIEDELEEEKGKKT